MCTDQLSLFSSKQSIHYYLIEILMMGFINKRFSVINRMFYICSFYIDVNDKQYQFENYNSISPNFAIRW